MELTQITKKLSEQTATQFLLGYEERVKALISSCNVKVDDLNDSGLSSQGMGASKIVTLLEEELREIRLQLKRVAE